MHRAGRDGDRRDSGEVVAEHRVQRTRSLSCRRHGEGTPDRHGDAKRFGDNFLVLHAVYSWILRRSGWLLNRFFVGRDGYTAFQRYNGRIYNGEVCDLFECVLPKVPETGRSKAG